MTVRSIYDNKYNNIIPDIHTQIMEQFSYKK